jgi:hypothetical protein
MRSLANLSQLNATKLNTYDVFKHWCLMTRNSASIEIRPQTIPHAGDSWSDILLFMDINSQIIQGYEYARAFGGHDAFVVMWEDSFARSGALPNNLHELLSLVYLIYRRNVLAEIFTNIDVYRPIIDACLEKAHKLS